MRTEIGDNLNNYKKMRHLDRVGQTLVLSPEADEYLKLIGHANLPNLEIVTEPENKRCSLFTSNLIWLILRHPVKSTLPSYV